MRIAQKKQALEFVQTLYQAHDQIKKLTYRKNNELAMELLEQCQEGAIQLGNLIEKYEGENCVVINIIERYCEKIYIVYSKIEKGEDLSKPIKLLHKDLLDIDNSIRDKIQEKLEIVFLPYNASMWDSFESIWKAAEADENCNVYVIPIPYYTKNPDGRLGEEHWEGDILPDYVSIINYKEYNFEERHPDKIFIHNPYDDCNIVTSVHPFFFSSNLLKYTDELVYIPYFILDEASPDNKYEVEAIQHFCTVPGVINAHKVIVQSENMRRIYIDVLVRDVGRNTRRYWEDKILGLGSPKVDKVLTAKKDELKIPDKWKSIILMQDGSRKKIVLYNTSIGSLLQHGERMLEKMEDVFDTFKKYNDDIALLWRPHPLIKATIESMLPQLKGRYQDLIKWYNEEGWGIYDDSSDMNKAVTLSDAYYGDESSLVQLCSRSGKSIMLQNVAVRNNIDDRWLSLMAEDCVQVDNQLIFIAKDINIIYSLDLKTGEIVIIDSIPEENVLETRLGAKIVHWKEELIFAPMNAKKIWIYNIKTKQWHGLERKKIEGNKTKLEMFEAVLFKNTMFIIGSNYPAIICLDLQTENMTYVEEPYVWLKEKKEELTDCYFRCGYVQKENFLYLASCLQNLVLKFNMETYDHEWIKVGDDNNRYSGIEWDGKNFWLAPRKNTTIVKWDGVDTAIEYPLPAEFQDENFHFLGVVCEQDNIVFPGLLSPYKIVISDLEQEEMRVMKGQYSFYKKINNMLLISQDLEGNIHIKDKEGPYRKINCRIKKLRIRKYLEDRNVEINEYLISNFVRESDMFDKKDFLYQVSKIKSNEKMLNTNNYGRNIWEKLRS